MLPGLITFLEDKFKEDIENALTTVFKLIGAISQLGNQQNLKILLNEVDGVI